MLKPSYMHVCRLQGRLLFKVATIQGWLISSGGMHLVGNYATKTV